MDHIAIMNKSWNLLPKIISGQKRIESRWYKAKFSPWNKIFVGDTVYFKDAGRPITVKADVEKVLQFENYDSKKLKEILYEYSEDICFVSSANEVFDWAKNREYCILIFLKNPQEITSFEIDKTGFGNACAWICIEDINKIKRGVI